LLSEGRYGDGFILNLRLAYIHVNHANDDDDKDSVDKNEDTWRERKGYTLWTWSNKLIIFSYIYKLLAGYPALIGTQSLTCRMHYCSSLILKSFLRPQVTIVELNLFHCAYPFKQKNHIFYPYISRCCCCHWFVFRPFSHSSFICSSFNLVYVANCGNDVALLAMKWLPTESQMDSIFFILGLSVCSLICLYR